MGGSRKNKKSASSVGMTRGVDANEGAGGAGVRSSRVVSDDSTVRESSKWLIISDIEHYPMGMVMSLDTPTSIATWKPFDQRPLSNAYVRKLPLDKVTQVFEKTPTLRSVMTEVGFFSSFHRHGSIPNSITDRLCVKYGGHSIRLSSNTVEGVSDTSFDVDSRYIIVLNDTHEENRWVKGFVTPWRKSSEVVLVLTRTREPCVHSFRQTAINNSRHQFEHHASIDAERSVAEIVKGEMEYTPLQQRLALLFT